MTWPRRCSSAFAAPLTMQSSGLLNKTTSLENVLFFGCFPVPPWPDWLRLPPLLSCAVGYSEIGEEHLCFFGGEFSRTPLVGFSCHGLVGVTSRRHGVSSGACWRPCWRGSTSVPRSPRGSNSWTGWGTTRRRSCVHSMFESRMLDDLPY